MSKKALLVIDMQSGNFTGDNPIYNGLALVRKVKSLIDRARAASIPVFYIQNHGSKGDPDEIGTAGWEIHHSIAPREGDTIIQKATPDSFHETNLIEELKSRKVGELVITGLQTEYCIDTTCRRAFSLGYSTTLVKDGHSTWDSEDLTAQQIIDHHNSVLGDWFVNLKKEKELTF